MDVSYIVPVYNALPYLEKTVESLMGQTCDASCYEVIFVDDGSTDESGAYLDKVAARHTNVKVIHIDPSGGPAHPRNIGIAEASGDYLFFCDSDDWMELDATERMMKWVREWGSDVLVVRAQGEGGRGLPFAVFDETLPKASPYGAVAQALGPCKLFKASLVRELGLEFDESLPVWEDQEFVARAYLGARTVSVDADEVYCHWLLHEDESGSGHVTEKRDTLPFEVPFNYLKKMLAVGNGREFDGSLAARAIREGVYYAARSLSREGAGPARSAHFAELQSLVASHVVDETWLWLNAHRSFLLEALLSGDELAFVELASMEKGEFGKAMVFSESDPSRCEWTSSNGSTLTVGVKNHRAESFQVESVEVIDGRVVVSGRIARCDVGPVKNGMLQIKKRGFSEFLRASLCLERRGDVLAWCARIPVDEFPQSREQCFWDIRLRLNIGDRRCFSGRVRAPEAATSFLSGPVAATSFGSMGGCLPVPYRTKGGFLAFANVVGSGLAIKQKSGKDGYCFEGGILRLPKSNPSLRFEVSFGKRGPVAKLQDAKWHECPASPWKLGVKRFGSKVQAWAVCSFPDGLVERILLPVRVR